MTKMKKPSRGNVFSVGNLMKIPASLGTLRSFWDAVNWKEAQADVQRDLQRKVVITGLANTGKSTLFNKLQGKYRSVVSSVPGTTRSLIQGMFGPFTLIDTPGHLPDLQESGAQDAAVIVMLLDATQSLRPDDKKLYERLKALKRPMIIVMNKADLVRGNPEVKAASFAAQLGADDVMPISALTGANITSDLLPTIIDASPEAALAIGRNLPEFRRKSADKVVRNAALVCLAAGLEPIPLVDIPIIIGAQIRMILRLGAIYGEPLSEQHVRELLGAISSSLALRFLAEQAAKVVPIGGDLVSGAIAGAGTWAIGAVALEYYGSGKKLTPQQMRETFNRVYQRLRTQQKAGQTPPELQPIKRMKIDEQEGRD
jgi:small GTP-binding protein